MEMMTFDKWIETQTLNQNAKDWARLAWDTALLNAKLLPKDIRTQSLIDECNQLRRAFEEVQRPYRYQAAIAAMNGILSADDDQIAENVAKRAVAQADALLLRLFELNG